MKRSEDSFDGDRTVAGDSHSSSDDSKLADLVFEYIERLNNGEKIDERQILGDQPELGPAIVTELRTFRHFDSELPASDSEPLATLGDYTLRRQIGRGGMGVLCEAFRYVE